MRDIISDDGNPRMLSPFVNRIVGRGKIWISEGTNRYRGDAGHRFRYIGDCGTAFGAETKAGAASAFSVMSPDVELACQLNAFVRPPGLSGERAARPFLTVKAVADGHANRLASASHT
jgi:hypothetical protein